MKNMALVILAIFGLSTQAWAAVRAGTISEMAGSVIIVRGETALRYIGRVGVAVDVGDTIETAANGKAKLLLGDDSVITISPNSKFRISRALYDPAKKSRDTSFTLLAGKVRSLVSKFWGGTGTNFEVRTPTAVAGVRGTEFIQEVGQDGSTTITVLEGSVEVYNAKDGKKRAVTLKQGQRTSVKEGKTPAAPHDVPAGELEQMSQDNEISSDESDTTGGDDGQSNDDDSNSDSDSNEGSNGNSDSDGSDDTHNDEENHTDGLGSDTNLNIPKSKDLINQQVNQMPTSTKVKVKVDF